jgi:hypothetical protein
MIRTLFILLLFVFLSFAGGDKVEHSFDAKNLKCTYETSQGRIDGNYVSYYKNGNKKAKGKYENNYRSGKWSVWDSTGRLRMQRDYSDPFTFKRSFPEAPKDKVVELLYVPQYTIAYNKNGFIDYYVLKERAIVMSKRIWRFVKPNENAALFEKNRFFSVLNKNIFNKNITPYKTTDDEFKNELPLKGIDTSSIQVIGYKIKEDFFFDNDRLVSESRISGICPVVVNNVKHDTLDLYWVYFPQIRKYLAKEKVLTSDHPSKIKTLDDLFFYRYFYAQIYKESNVNDRPIAKYKSGKEIEKEAERIEISLIESEQDIWLSFTE